MPLGKDDNPTKAKAEAATDKAADQATQELTDAAAGAPPAQQDAAEALPEGDTVKDAIKEGMLAETAQDEAQAKVKVVEDSTTGAEDTPSGAALIKTAGIADNVERGEAYAREKSAKRWGTVPADDDKS